MKNKLVMYITLIFLLISALFATISVYDYLNKDKIILDEDLSLAILIDGEPSNELPGSGYVLKDFYCESIYGTRNLKDSAIGRWDKNSFSWKLELKNINKGNAKCYVKFKSVDTNGLLNKILINNDITVPLTKPGEDVIQVTVDNGAEIIINDQNWRFDLVSGNTVTRNCNYGTCNLLNVTTETYPPYDEGKAVGRYISTINITNKEQLNKTTNLTGFFLIKEVSGDNLVLVAANSNNMTNETEAVLAFAEDDYGLSAYYRGVVKNNYVEFANKCWRIVRVDGNGNIRMILYNDNIDNTDYPCKESNLTADGTFATFNDNQLTDYNAGTMFLSNAGVGFMHGLSTITTDEDRCLKLNSSNEVEDIYSNTHGIVNETTCESVENGGVWTTTAFEATHANIKKSTALEALIEWYNNNIKTYESKLSDVEWCQDKTLVEGLGFGAYNTSFYAPNKRLNSLKRPSLICNNINKVNRLTSVNTGVKAGLLTADEAAFAGMIVVPANETISVTNNYLLDNVWGKNWWTMTPSNHIPDFSYTTVYKINSIGNLYNGKISSVFNSDAPGYIRPMVALPAKTDVSGNGTSEDPYVVE